MTTGNLNIHTENLLPIIKRWLYSDKEIFVRELLSNACDAVQKCKILREHGELEIPDAEFKIELLLDRERRTLTFIDNGIGMTQEEVEKYIAQVAFSGAEAFADKYKANEQIIGHFGLGFYSAYMVAERVEIDTRSYKEGAEAVIWECDGSSTYTLRSGAREGRGTQITLFLDKESDEFLEEGRIRSILQRHCSFLPVPIFFNGTQINEKTPLWLKNAAECTEEEYLAFYRTLYPHEPDPIFWIHLNVDYPFHLKGILYFPKVTRRFDWNQNTIKLFCNRVFVSDNCKDLIPDYLMILRGAIDSPDIPLNVSRSTLQMDKTVRQLSAHISKKVTDRLNALYMTEPAAFYQAWPDIELIVKLGILQDEKFYERAKEFLVFKTLSGEWTTLKDKSGKVFYTSYEDPEAHLNQLYLKQGVEILSATSPVDTPLISFLESKMKEVQFQRVDGAIDTSILDESREKTLLDGEGKTFASRIGSFFEKILSNVKVEAKSLHSEEIPALLIIDESMRRMQETFLLTQRDLPSQFLAAQTFVLNTNHPLVASIDEMQEKDSALAGEMAQHLYEMTLLSQRALDPKQLGAFVERSARLLLKVT